MKGTVQGLWSVALSHRGMVTAGSHTLGEQSMQLMNRHAAHLNSCNIVSATLQQQKAEDTKINKT